MGGQPIGLGIGGGASETLVSGRGTVAAVDGILLVAAWRLGGFKVRVPALLPNRGLCCYVFRAKSL
jgi:hypothetical protein